MNIIMKQERHTNMNKFLWAIYGIYAAIYAFMYWGFWWGILNLLIPIAPIWDLAMKIGKIQ